LTVAERDAAGESANREFTQAAFVVRVDRFNPAVGEIWDKDANGHVAPTGVVAGISPRLRSGAGEGPARWRVDVWHGESRSIIAVVTEGATQLAVMREGGFAEARLMAAAPELLAALEAIVADPVESLPPLLAGRAWRAIKAAYGCGDALKAAASEGAETARGHARGLSMPHEGLP